MNEVWARRLLRAWPFLVLALLAVVFVLMLLFSRKAPTIASLEPAMAAPGQQVVVTGDYFGRTEREGSLSLAGEIPPPSLILSWSDQKIVFVVPEDASSGLVSVANSQGTSPGVLFTNTETIPTVLQAAAAPAAPLLWAASPSQPVPGQTVTLLGRGFGFGDEAVSVSVAVTGGPVIEFGPSESQVWSDRSVSFRWPQGADAAAVSVQTPRGQSAPFVVGTSIPVTLENPRTLVVEFKAKVTQPPATALVLWGPVPQRSAMTNWSLLSSDPGLPAATRQPLFSWSAGSGGERQAVYKLSLTTWAKRWNGLPSGVTPGMADSPAGDDVQRALWKPASAALKALTARWGLDTSDPWLKLQRLQTGLAALGAAVGPAEAPGLTRTPAELLTSAKFDSYEISSLAVALAGQAGIPARLVGGLWAADDAPRPRTWAEAWIPGAGWVSWDVIDGTPGALDNRHFAFDPGTYAPARRAARSQTFGPAAPGTLLPVTGEATGPGPEPVVQWQITRSEK